MSCVNFCSSFVNIRALCQEMCHQGSIIASSVPSGVPICPRTRRAVHGSTRSIAPPSSVYLTEKNGKSQKPTHALTNPLRRSPASVNLY
jgi:hypothetical protein